MSRNSLAIIPAKGASTRLPKKNILPLAGKPLVGWTIEAAIDSKQFNKVVVSSEDDGVLDVASKWPVELIKRPPKLAVDPAGCIDVAKHVITELESHGEEYGCITILMPTSPFRTAQDISSAMESFLNNNINCLISVSEFSHTPFNALVINEQNQLAPINTSGFGKKTQELPVAYRPNGAIFIMEINTIKSSSSLFPEPMCPYIMSQERSIDIDNQLDLEWAEFFLDKKS